MSDELTTKIKSILHNLRVSGGAAARKTVIAIGNGVLKARCPVMLDENGGCIALTTNWARGVLKSLDWVKTRYATAKTEINPARSIDIFLEEKNRKCNFWAQNSEGNDLELWSNCSWIHSSEQIFSYWEKGSFCTHRKCWWLTSITAALCVNIVGDFLPVQLIYGGVTDKCHPKVNFPESFHIIHSQNHWSNKDIVMEYLNKIIFPYIKSKR